MSDKMPCKFCGAILPRDATFCPSCGSILTSPLLAPSTPAKPRPQRQPKIGGPTGKKDRSLGLDKRRASKFQLTRKQLLKVMVLLIAFLVIAVIVGGALHIPTGGNTTASPMPSSSHALYAHRIVCVGDSITEGFASPNNWPYHLKEIGRAHV